MNGWIIFLLVVQYLFVGVVVAAVYDGNSRDEGEDGNAVAIIFAWPVFLFVLLIWAASKLFVFVYMSLVAMIRDDSDKGKACLYCRGKGGSCALFDRECIGPSKCPAYTERKTR